MEYQIDKADIAALRKAHDVVFSHSNGESRIRGILSRHGVDGGVQVTIACGTHFTDYAKERTFLTQLPVFTAFEMIGAVQYSESWQTIVRLLRVGDKLTLHWRRDSWRTSNLDAADLHGDDLQLIVDRSKNARVTARMVFNVRTSICPDNTARMIRDVHYHQNPQHYGSNAPVSAQVT